MLQALTPAIRRRPSCSSTVTIARRSLGSSRWGCAGNMRGAACRRRCLCLVVAGKNICAHGSDDGDDAAAGGGGGAEFICLSIKIVETEHRPMPLRCHCTLRTCSRLVRLNKAPISFLLISQDWACLRLGQLMTLGNADVFRGRSRGFISCNHRLLLPRLPKQKPIFGFSAAPPWPRQVQLEVPALRLLLAHRSRTQSLTCAQGLFGRLLLSIGHISDAIRRRLARVKWGAAFCTL